MCVRLIEGPKSEDVQVPAGTTAAEMFKGDRAVVAATVSGVLRDLSHVLADGDTVAAVAADSPEGLAILRHSCAHVMAQAVQALFPGAKLGIGPPIRDGFYYDFGVEKPFQPDDLERIESRMREIVKSGQLFVRREVEEGEARDELKDEPFKLELVELKGAVASQDEANVEVGEGGLSVYDNVDRKSGQTVWHDLCRGPHVPTTRYIPAFRLMRTAAAYWRGSEKRPQLQRIYGTAWASKDALAAYLHMLEEAERRDHRRIGKELELFHFDPTAPGMPYWLPKGLRVLNSLLAFWRDEHERRGYDEIASPLVNNKRLWETSGHWDHYRENMFLIENDERDSVDFALKPMNCPNAMVVYNLKTRSYRDLPLRLSDCDMLHRSERSGTLHGLLRVQEFRQDDAHVFIPPDRIDSEINEILDICDRFYGIFDLKFSYRLGTRPESFIGDVDTWSRAEKTLVDILNERTGGAFGLEQGGGAFYGPKIDILMSDVLGRSWQMGTVQLDFNLPRRFGCVYSDDRGTRQTPVVIHRVIYGSLERFLGIYIEHTSGAFPLWLAPVHVAIIPVATDYVDYARTVAGILRDAGARVELDSRDETLNARVRHAQRQKVPLTVVVGAREAENGTLSVRPRGQRSMISIATTDLARQLSDAIGRRTDLALGI